MGRKTVQHKYFTKEKWEKVNSDNVNIVEEFMNYLSAIGKSKQTQVKYFNNLQIFFVWVLDNLKNKFIVDINKKDIMKWQNSLMVLGLSSSRIRVLRSSVSSLCNYIENMCDEEYPNFRNIVNKVPAPKLEYIREKTYLDIEEFEIIKQELINREDWQKLVYFCLSYDSASRRNEVYGVLKDIDFINNKTCIVRGKGGKTFPLYFSDETKEYIKKWLEIRGEDNCNKLFIIKNGQKVKEAKYSTLYTWCETFSKILKEKTGKDVVIYPHSFKANRLSHLYYDSKLPINVIQEYGHHESSETTLKSYIEKRNDDVINQVFKLDNENNDNNENK